MSWGVDIVERMFDRLMMFDNPAEGLEAMEPGPVLAAFLSSIDVNGLSGQDQIRYVQATQRMASHYQARMYDGMAAVTDTMEKTGDDPEFGAEAAEAEIRMALRLTRRAATSEMALADTLKRRLPAMWDRLAAGDIDVRRAWVIAKATDHLPTEAARQVVNNILDRAPQLTTGQLGALIRKTCLETNPDEAAERYEHATEQRRLVMEPSVDGTAHLLAMDLTPDKATAAADRINDLAKKLRTGEEPRSMDQLRADVFIDLLLGTGQSHKGRGKKAVVDIRVDLTTLAGLNNSPGELGGYGPVIADIARQVAEDQTDQSWRYTITDPETGLPVDGGILKRRPNQRQRRITQTLYPTCITPTCRHKATDSDIDHRKAYADGGATSVDNSGPLCRHDHRLKHTHGWTYQPIPGGDHLWTTKLGLKYTTSGKPP